MAEQKIPTELDWVDARSRCSMREMFTTLRNEIIEDIKKRNERREGEQVQFHIGALSGNGFSVFREGSSDTASVDFQLGERSILVTNGDGGEMFKATLTLNDQGRCKFTVAGKGELETWQVRRMALEELFFQTGKL